MTLAFDHVVYAVGELNEAGDRFRDELGLGSVPGGRHPGFGTANRIVPLGDSYIELIAVVDPAEALGTDFGRMIHGTASAGGGWAAYALRTDRLEEHAEGHEIVEMIRRKPDGSLLEWRLARLDDVVGEHRWPFLIEWGVGVGDLPGTTPVDHAVRPTGIRWLEVGGPIAPHAAHLDIRAVDGPAGLARVGIGLEDGELIV